MDENSKLPISRSDEIALPSATEVHISSTVFPGPLPPPDILGEYERCYPGAAERVIQFAEREAEHRRSLEQWAVRTESDRIRRDFDEAGRGQICALIITLAAVAAGAYTAITGHEVAGSIIGVGGIGSIVTTFLVGRSRGKSPADSQPRSD